eukprot:gene2573-8541_t
MYPIGSGPYSVVCNVRKGATKRDARRVFGNKVMRFVVRKFKVKKQGQPKRTVFRGFVYFDTAEHLEAAWPDAFGASRTALYPDGKLALTAHAPLDHATGNPLGAETEVKRRMRADDRLNRKTVAKQVQYAAEVGADFRSHLTRDEAGRTHSCARATLPDALLQAVCTKRVAGGGYETRRAPAIPAPHPFEEPVIASWFHEQKVQFMKLKVAEGYALLQRTGLIHEGLRHRCRGLPSGTLLELHIRILPDGELAPSTGGGNLCNKGLTLFCPRCMDLEHRRKRCAALVKQNKADEEETRFAAREPYTFLVPPYFGTMLDGDPGRGAPLRHPALLFEYMLDTIDRDTPRGAIQRRYRVTHKCKKISRTLLLAIAAKMERIQVVEFHQALGASEADEEEGFVHLEMDGVALKSYVGSDGVQCVRTAVAIAQRDKPGVVIVSTGVERLETAGATGKAESAADVRRPLKYYARPGPSKRRPN